jgi:hypothetical protein
LLLSHELINGTIKIKYYFECKRIALGIAFCYIGRYGGDFVEKFRSRLMDTTKSLLVCFFFFSFLGQWKGIKSQACIVYIMLHIY